MVSDAITELFLIHSNRDSESQRSSADNDSQLLGPNAIVFTDF